MRVSIELDTKGKFETDLPEEKATELFNRFVCDSISLQSVKQEEEVECEEVDIYNTDSYYDTSNEVLNRTQNLGRNTNLIPKGFLYIECDKCGRRKGFCSRIEMSHYRCDECGYDSIIQPHKLRKMKVECDNCGGVYNYVTNVQEDKLELQCFNCNNIIPMFYFKRDNIYYLDKEV